MVKLWCNLWENPGPRWSLSEDLKISEYYVEYLTHVHVSSEYNTSWALLSLRSTTGWTSCIFLVYVMPWINKAKLVLYIARIIVKGLACAWDCSATNLKYIVHCVVEFVFVIEALKLLLSRLRVSLRLHLHDFWCRYRCVHILLMTFYHMHHYTMQLLGIWSSAQYSHVTIATS